MRAVVSVNPLRSALLAALLLVAVALPSCIIDDNDSYQTSSPPPQRQSTNQEECCRDVQVCDTVCDDTGCYDECRTKEVCASSCIRSCAGDFDCTSGEVCTDGVCLDRDHSMTGTGGLCQSCQSAYDCAEPDARCVRLYFERTPEGGPKVCATDCENEADCPLGFECVDSLGTARVCVPEEEIGSTDRVCPEPLPDGIGCFDSEDCGDGESCIDNECVPIGGRCSRDDDCGAGSVCRNQTCVDDSEPECLDRQDCRSDEVCVDGSCTPRFSGGTCVRNDDCTGEAVCVDGDCLTKCGDRSECNSSSEICRQGLCQPIECRFNSDCDTAEVCVDARCEPKCSDSGDCSSGFICSETGHYCIRDPDVECRSDAECLTGESCHEGSCTTICGCNQECADGQVCDPELTDATNTGLCTEPTQTSTTSECENDCQCPSGQECVEGSCQ